jgi:drug/metabolite transporter (DMT)-like permease
MLLVFAWTTTLAYVSSSVLYQLGNLQNDPVFATTWIIGALAVLVAFILSLKRLGPKSLPGNLIPVTQLN